MKLTETIEVVPGLIWGKRYLATIELLEGHQHLPTITGHRKIVHVGSFRTMRKAERALGKMVEELTAQLNPEPPEIIFRKESWI